MKKKYFFLLFLFASTTYSQVTDFEWINSKPQGNTLRTVKVFNQNHFVIAGDAGTIMTTYNGGNSWQSYYLNTPHSDRDIGDIVFADSTTGYVCGSYGMIFKTIDGGITWSSINSPAGYALSSLCFINKDTGYVGGAIGLLFKTTNGGATWSNISIPQTVNGSFIRGISFFQDTGYASCIGTFTKPRIMVRTGFVF